MPSPAWIRALGAVLLLGGPACVDDAAIALVGSPGPGKADAPAPTLWWMGSHRTAVDEPSDLVAVDGALFAVSDVHSRIYQLDDDGDVVRDRDVHGRDLEALGWDPAAGEFVIGDEATARLWHVDADGDRHDPIELDDADDGNSGVEGVAALAGGGWLVAKEKDPAQLLVLGADPTAPARVIDVDWARDLSALTVDPATGAVLALSDEDATLFLLDRDLVPVVSWRLRVPQLEGLAIVGDDLYLVSDRQERLYHLRLER